MKPDFWHDRWRTGQIGFHQLVVDKHLGQYWPTLCLADNARVFVPLCGKSLDLKWLLQRELSVTGVELSATAVESFCMEQGIAARRRTLGSFNLYETTGLRLLCGDFFSLTPSLLGPVDAIYDRAALISWMPELRTPYAEHLTALTSPGTQTLLVTMEYPQAQMKGPPFSVSADDVHELYARRHTVQELGRRDIWVAEPRLRARGVTELFEVCYRMTRL